MPTIESRLPDIDAEDKDLMGRLLNAKLCLDVALSGTSDNPAEKVAEARAWIDAATEEAERIA